MILKGGKKVSGTFCGIGAAVCYGTNPLGALNLYGEGMATNCVLFYRFSMAFLILAVVMLFRKESLHVAWQDFKVVSSLGILFIFSSLSLYLSFLYMPAGIASTILFTYPIMTVLIMLVVYRERASILTWLCIALATAGVVLLYWTGDGSGTLSPEGVILVLISALTYAIYIVLVGKAKLQCSSFKINFYVLLWCAIGMLVYTALGNALMSPEMRAGSDGRAALVGPLLPPHNFRGWFYVTWLAAIPGIAALVMMVYSSKYTGATTTSILGALEPLTAVIIGIFVFHESFTTHLAVGIVLIITAVTIIAYSQVPHPRTQQVGRHRTHG